MAGEHDPQARLSLARHEAGHAVAAFLQGATLHGATVVPNDGCLGMVEVGYLPFPSLQGHLDRDEQRALVNGWKERELMIDLAGRAAESLWLVSAEGLLSDEFDQVWNHRPQGSANWSPTVSLSDLGSFWSHSDMSRAIKKSLNILGGVTGEQSKAYVAGVFCQVMALLLSGRNQQVVDELAGRLMSMGEMSGDEVRAFLTEAYGLASPPTGSKLRRRPPGELPTNNAVEAAREQSDMDWIRRGDSALAGWVGECGDGGDDSEV